MKSCCILLYLFWELNLILSFLGVESYLFFFGSWTQASQLRATEGHKTKADRATTSHWQTTPQRLFSTPLSV